MAPFLKTAMEVAKKQCEDQHDFLLEAPLTKLVMSMPLIKDMTAEDHVNVCGGSSWNTGKKVWWLTSAPAITSQLDKFNDLKGRAKNPIRMIKNVMLGFGEALHQKEPERVKAFLRSCDARIRGAGIYAEQNIVNLVHLLNSRADHDTYAIYDEKTDVPEGGIEFDLPPELYGEISKALLSSVRRLHFNSGHPPSSELERIVRLSGGSELARAAVKGTRCSVFERLQRQNLQSQEK